MSVQGFEELYEKLGDEDSLGYIREIYHETERIKARWPICWSLPVPRRLNINIVTSKFRQCTAKGS
jgi:hypothetical protein